MTAFRCENAVARDEVEGHVVLAEIVSGNRPTCTPTSDLELGKTPRMHNWSKVPPGSSFACRTLRSVRRWSCCRVECSVPRAALQKVRACIYVRHGSQGVDRPHQCSRRLRCSGPRTRPLLIDTPRSSAMPTPLVSCRASIPGERASQAANPGRRPAALDDPGRHRGRPRSGHSRRIRRSRACACRPGGVARRPSTAR